MATSLNDKLKKMPKERLKKILNHADNLMEEMSLRDLRIALEKTQVELSNELHMQQDGISRLERRSDLLLSTLRKYISAMGGELELVVRFPKRPSILIRGITDIESDDDAKGL